MKHLGVTASLLFLLLFPFGPSSGQTPKSARPDTTLKDARAAFNEKKYEKVLEILTPQVERLPRSGLVLMAESYENLDNGLAAIKTYRTILAKNEKDLGALVAIAKVQRKLNKEGDAINTLKDALEIDKRYEPAHFGLVDLYEKQKRAYPLRIQLEDMEKFVKPPRLAEVKAKLCKINLDERFHAQAKSKCRDAIQENPKNPDNYVHLGTAYKETGDLEEAAKHLHRAADSFKSSENAQYQMGQFYLERKKTLKAHDYFVRSVKADAKSVRALVALGLVCVELQKFQQALDHFNAACALDRTAEKDLRRAANLVRQMKLDPWQDKFESAAEKCSGLGVFN